MSEFAQGLCFWLKGWQHNLRHPGLLFLCLVPLFLSALLVVPLIWILFNQLPEWSHDLVGALLGWASPFWQDIVFYPLIVSVGLAILVGSLFVFYILHTLLAIPFYSVLAERVIRATGKKPQARHSVWRMVRAGVIKACVLLPTGMILFVCSFVPGLNVVAVAGTMLILAFDVMDYAFEASGFGLRRRISYLLHHRAQWLGMAAGLALTLLVPTLTLFVLPGAVTGAALILKVNHDEP